MGRFKLFLARCRSSQVVSCSFLVLVNIVCLQLHTVSFGRKWKVTQNFCIFLTTMHFTDRNWISKPRIKSSFLTPATQNGSGREIVMIYMKAQLSCSCCISKKSCIAKSIRFLPLFVIDTIIHCCLSFVDNLITHKEYRHQINDTAYLPLSNVSYPVSFYGEIMITSSSK